MPPTVPVIKSYWCTSHRGKRERHVVDMDDPSSAIHQKKIYKIYRSKALLKEKHSDEDEDGEIYLGRTDHEGSVDASDSGWDADQSDESSSNNAENKSRANGILAELGSDEDTEEEPEDEGIFCPSHSEDVQCSSDSPPRLPAPSIVDKSLILPAITRSTASQSPHVPSVSPASLEEPCALVLLSKSASIRNTRANTTKRSKGKKEAQRSLPKDIAGRRVSDGYPRQRPELLPYPSRKVGEVTALIQEEEAEQEPQLLQGRDC
ncbi:hypothetical protein BDK51DRAFT_35327 [Blyttiomyces helicus]|uniref:Uncharacterized protein n=1 Tax=Blyttiomyces helicus TaxID=388810 RepID=A0A4P9W3N5_9FUNG|nr:hypothetical protein BDK51DRAFT_35327 [Blyttiomyces helicus]|eukprot:RKO85905.1 hypothetical protein BDK51DRAFT_35327 [Blyttiomyces helicus]